MEVVSARLASTWVPTEFPSTTTLSSVATSAIPHLTQSIGDIAASIANADKVADGLFLLKSLRGAQASLTIAQAQQVLATATDPQVEAMATGAIYNATLNLINLETKDNFYGTSLSLGGNAVFVALFGLLLVWFIGITVWSKHVYFGVCLTFGTGLEFAGYLARSLAADVDLNNLNKFLCQFICLTLAPVFIMAGIYYVLGQLVAIYGRQYSRLPPMWYSYIFIVCDVISLVVQAAGGGMAGTAFSRGEDDAPGTYTMVGGISFQVLLMSLFLLLLGLFLRRVWFSGSVSFSWANLFAMLFNTAKGKQMKQSQDVNFEPKYAQVRRRPLFGYLPLVIIVSVGFIYVRCIYRLVELAEGWRGYLITHEVYLFVLEATMIFCGCVWYTLFHPAVVCGRDADLSTKAIREKNGEVEYEKEWSEADTNEPVTTDAVESTNSKQW